MIVNLERIIRLTRCDKFQNLSISLLKLIYEKKQNDISIRKNFFFKLVFFSFVKKNFLAKVTFEETHFADICGCTRRWCHVKILFLSCESLGMSGEEKGEPFLCAFVFTFMAERKSSLPVNVSGSSAL